MFIRTVKVPSSNGTVNEYVRVVEAFRLDGKVKQRVVADLGRKDFLQELLPNLIRVLRGDLVVVGQNADVDILQAWTWGPVLVVRALFDQLGLNGIFDQFLGQPRKRDDTLRVPYADRLFVLIANRLIRPSSEHGLARWLDNDFVCDRLGRRFVPHWHRRGRVQVDFRQLQSWYRTLDRLVAAKNNLEVALYGRLRDLFSLKPELVLYDITSTYFEGAGPTDFAKHGYSRDGKPQNVQVVVGLVMVAGWPIAHHVWEGNTVDSTTVQKVVADLMARFEFRRVVFVGDRGMVSEENLVSLQKDGHGYLLGVRRRQNAELDGYLQRIDETRWQDCPVGITSREKKKPPRTRVQEVTAKPAPEDGDESTPQRIFIIDSDERRVYEESKRGQAQERTRVALAKLQERVASGRLRSPEEIGAAAARILQRHHGHRYFAWELRDGAFHFFDHPVNLEREKRLEGKYVVMTSERDWDAVDAVQHYKELADVERSFRHLKDVLALRPIYHQVQPRVAGHIFVAFLALLLERLLAKRLRAARLDLSPMQALQAVESVRVVEFRLNGENRRGVSRGSPRALQVLKALGICNPKPPTPPEGPPEVM
jgi:transposase